MVVAILNRVVSARLTEEIFYKMLEGVERSSNASPLGKNIPGRGNREQTPCGEKLLCSRKRKEARKLELGEGA